MTRPAPKEPDMLHTLAALAVLACVAAAQRTRVVRMRAAPATDDYPVRGASAVV